MLKYRLRKIGRKKIIFWSTTAFIFLISMVSIVRFYALSSSNITTHASGIDGDTVYVNDLTKDYNYYIGLNYTEITNARALPGGTNTNKYNDNNLLPVRIVYDGKDFNNTNLIGRVSNNETQSKFVYFKYYVIKNNKITIDLIDNPFTDRPTSGTGNNRVYYGFNGWVCNDDESDDDLCDNTTFSYDDTYYQRHLTIDLAGLDYSGGLNIYLNAFWYNANVYGVTSTNNFTTNINATFRAKGMVNITTQNSDVRAVYEVYTKHSRYVFKPGGTYYLNQNGGQPININNTPCNYPNTNYYVPNGNGRRLATAADFNLEDYYTWDQTDTKIGDKSNFSYNKTASLFYVDNHNHNGDANYYNAGGKTCDPADCSSKGYKLIQFGDSYSENLFTTADTSAYNTYVQGNTPAEGDRRFLRCTTGNVNSACVVNASGVNFANYFYLATRDLNILYLQTDLGATYVNMNYPVTVSAHPFNDGTTFTARSLTSNSVTAGNDLVLEHVRISTGRNFSGYGYNNKIGRDVRTSSNYTTYNTFENLFGDLEGSLSGTNKYSLIVESGFYDEIYLKHSTISTNVRGIIGSDYDRVNSGNPDGVNGGDNTKLKITNRLYSTDAVAATSPDALEPFATARILSGCIGCDNNFHFSGTNTAGAYMVSNQRNVYVLATSQLIFYGGYTKTIQGGAGYRTTNVENAVDIRVAGGTIGTIFGGARLFEANGNRIIMISGGNIIHNVFAGSNAYNTTSSTEGVGNFDTLTYIGGTAHIGATSDYTYTVGRNDMVFAETIGNVFGAGNGRSGYSAGAVKNSHVVINGGIVENNVYGGGNYGGVGTQVSTLTNTKVDMYAGNVKGSVFGGGNQIGAGQNAAAGATCNCGSPQCITGNTTYYVKNTLIPNGNAIPRQTYYDYNNTYVRNSANYNRTCGIAGGCWTYRAVGRGSAYDPNEDYYTIDYYNGYGGNSNYIRNSTTPSYCTVPTSTYVHSIEINKSGGEAKNVYGGSNQGGTIYGDVTINISGPTSGTNASKVTQDIFGGGLGQNTTVMGDVEVNINGGTGRDVYGGSALGRVNGSNAASSQETTVTVNAGDYRDVYGCGMGTSGNGINYPYTYGYSHVIINGGELDYVYGGNNTSGTASRPTDVQLKGGTINYSAFGGGNRVGHGETNIVLEGTHITGVVSGDSIIGGSLFGGSNNAGVVALSKVTIKSGEVRNVFGSNNAGGSTTETRVVYNGGTVAEDIYGGGNEAESGTTNVTINNGTLHNIYGGGREAGVSTATNVLIKQGTFENIYGGSNRNGTVQKSNVYITNGTMQAVFGGNNFNGKTKEAYVYVGNGTMHYEIQDPNDPDKILKVGGIYGGGNETDSGDTYVHVYGGTADGVYGGGRKAGAEDSHVYMYGGTAPAIFGGSNISGSVDTTLVEIKDTIPSCTTTTPTTGVVANPCYTRQTRNVQDVFGGGNSAPVTTSTTVKMYTGTVKNLYGGGNKSYVGDATVINGAFSTGISEGDTYVYLASGTVNNNVYGSGNASFVYGNTHVYVGKDALDELGAANVNNPSIWVKGNVFGGSETNSSGDIRFDYKYKGVVGSSKVYINGAGYSSANIKLDGSIYGGGNNSTVGLPIGEDPGPSYIYLSNYGSANSIKKLNSIQRAMYVYITDSVLEFNGERDRAEIDMYVYGFIRVDNLYLLGSSGTNTTGTTLYMNAGASYLSAYNSGTMGSGNTNNYSAANFLPQKVTINGSNVSIERSNNKLFMLSKVLFAVTNEIAPSYRPRGTDAGPVRGMTYLGMYYDRADNTRVFGIYDPNLTNSQYTSMSENQLKLCETSVEMEQCDPYTFVYGKHDYAPDTQVPTHGFYSHFETEEKDSMYPGFVGVTPVNATYYKWVLGKDVDIINVALQATKASVKSAQAVTITLESLKEALNGNEEELVDWHDAVMKINSIDTSQFAVKSADVKDVWDVKLVDKSRIPVVNTDVSTTTNGTHTVSDANKYFALSMGTTSTAGWMERYTTNFYSKGNILGDDFCELSEDGCVLDQEYTYDSTTNPRALSFWLYYAKNLDFDISTAPTDSEIAVINLGSVVLGTTFTNPHGDYTSTQNVRDVEIHIALALVDNKTSKYGTAINSGKHYSVFESNKPTITDDGVFSIYQMLSVSLKSPTDPTLTDKDLTAAKIYGSDVYRYLNSSTILPVGTTITMLDLKNGEQYYYDITTQNRNAIIQAQCGNNVSSCSNIKYRLEDFIRMGSTSPNNKYDDDMTGVNSKYFTENLSHDGSGVAVEEFIFNIDFSKVDSANRLVGDEYYIYMESENSATGESVMTPNGQPFQSMAYTIVNNTESNITATGGYLVDGNRVNDISIYNTEEAILELDANLVTKDRTTGQVINDVADTKYNDYKLGAKIIIMQARLDGNGNPVIVNGEQVYDPVTTNLFGTVVKIGPREYYPQSDGSIRVKLAGVMTNVISDIQFDFSNSDLEFGDYKMIVDTFASYDGLYEISGTTSKRNEFTFTLLNNEYGIDVTLPPVQVTRDVNTGKDKNGELNLTFNLKTKNGLHDPNVKVHLERRKYNSNYDTTYEGVSLGGIATSMSISGGSNVLNSCYSNLSNGDCYVYNLKNNLNTNYGEETFEVNMTMRPGPTAADKADMANAKWKSGTYRVVFTIYDGNTPIGSVYEYLIIRSLDVDEEVEGS